MNKELPSSKACVFPIGFRRGKTGNLIFASSELHLVNTRHRNVLNTCIVDCDWRESRLPWLDRVLLFFFGIGLKQVSWAVTYFDEL